MRAHRRNDYCTQVSESKGEVIIMTFYALYYIIISIYLRSLLEKVLQSSSKAILGKKD